MYTLRTNAVFETKEELQELLNEIMEQADRFGLENWPNVGHSKLDFDIFPALFSNVYKMINMQRLGILLGQTDIFDDYHNDFKSMLENIDEYISENDLNYDQVIRILNELISD